MSELNRSSGPVAIMCFSDGSGGMEQDALKLARRLCDDSKIVLVCKQGSFLHELAQKYAGCFRCEAISFSSRLFSVAMLVKVRRLIRKHIVKNVIFFGASELKTLHFAFLGFGLNVIVRHGTTKSKPKTDWLHRHVYSNVNYHVALSRHLLNNAKDIVPRTKGVSWKIIYPSLEFLGQKTDVTKEAPFDGLMLTHVGRQARGKGQVDAVLACKALAEAGVNFRLELLGGVEDEDYHAEIKQAVDRSGLADRVMIRGHISNVSDALAKSDIFLFPSYGEGMANAFIEALSFGLPCIAYDNTVFPEFIEMGFHITLADDRDLEDLSRKLLASTQALGQEKEASKGNILLASKYFSCENERERWRSILV